MSSCEDLGNVISSSIALGIVTGSKKAKGENIGVKLLSVLNETIKNFNENDGPRLAVKCFDKNNNCPCKVSQSS